MKKHLLIGLSSAIALAGMAHAAGFAWSPPRGIESVATESDGHIITLAGVKIVASSSCTNKFRIPSTDPDKDGKLDLVNHADANSLQVKVSYLSTSTACNVYIADIEIVDP